MPAARTLGEGERSRAAARMRISVGGVAFDNCTLADAIERVDELVRERRTAYVVTPNVDHVVRARRDPAYAQLVREADLVLADGQPILWAARLGGTPLLARVAGSDLFPRLCEHAAAMGYRVFFLGGSPGAAQAAADVLRRRRPDLIVAGVHCPPFGFERDSDQCREAAAAVRRSRPDIVFVGLGSPKQEQWIVRHMHEYAPAVSIGVGISFSFVAGHVKRAPTWMQRAGLEWLHRLSQEPRRLWRRYLVDGVFFLPVLAACARHRARRRGTGRPHATVQRDE